MATKKVSKREYRGSDSYTLENGQTLHDLFVLDLADFVAKVPDLDDPFADDWQDAIDAAINYTDDSVIQGQIAPQTLSVKEAMQAGKEKYNEVIFYAAQHFGKTSPVLKEFGKGKAYESAIRSQEKMFQFLDELSATANKYKTQLIAKGYTQAAIDQIATLRDALNTTNRAQNLAIKGRPVISEGRTIAYNLAYSYQRKVIDAAQLVYRTNPAKLNQYRYNPPVKHRYKAIFETTIEGNAIVTVQTDEDVRIEPHWIVTLLSTGGPALFYASTNPGNEPDGPTLTLPDGQTIKHTLQELINQLGYTPARSTTNIKNTGLLPIQVKVTYARPPKGK